jgi:hypothetical protein
VRNRRDRAPGETICVVNGWFVWSWAERIARVEDVAGAARDIARVLPAADAGDLRDVYRLATALHTRNVVAVPTGKTIRAWISPRCSTPPPSPG